MTHWRTRPIPPADNRARIRFNQPALQRIVAEAMAARMPELVFDPTDVTFEALESGSIITTAVGRSGLRQPQECSSDG
ncbi:hypothetical protein [Frigidibacter sp. MR17.24]|uniref:hypothetical protein n=1 Tax=Frigidibacter sp. MR17.24 TaxID=3127345 RepID=UPI003012B257